MGANKKLICKECGYTAEFDDIPWNGLPDDAKKNIIETVFKGGAIHKCPHCESPMEEV